jgi:hypothetical protein
VAERKKLEPSGNKGIFIGYSDTSKAYKIYVPGQQKIEISRDVNFDEKIAFKKSIEDSMDSIDEEEHEDPKEGSTCSPEHFGEEPDQPLEPVDQVLHLRTENDQHGKNPPYKKQKDIKLLVAPSWKARSPKGSLVMRHS